MHYKTLLPLIIILQFPAFAGSGDTPMQTQLQAKAVLEHRLRFCRQFEKREINPSEWFDLWLQSQPIEVRRKVLWNLHLQANERCYGAERDAYSIALIKYTAITGDRTLLDDWISFYDDPGLKRDIQLPFPETEYNKQLNRLSQLPAFYMPFNAGSAVDAIIPDQEWLLGQTVQQTFQRTPYIKGLIINGLHIQ
jgi:hypothetical protein